MLYYHKLNKKAKNEERYTRVISHLKERGTPKDFTTIELLEKCRK